MREEEVLATRIRVTDTKNRPYGVMTASYNPLEIALDIRISDSPVVPESPDCHGISPETMFKLRCLDATAIDDSGNKYEVYKVEDKKDGVHSAVLHIKPVEQKPRATPALKELASWALKRLWEDGIISDSVSLGYAENKITDCLVGVFCQCPAVNDANPEPRPE